MQRYHLLLVDDDHFTLQGIGDELESNGYQVTRASSGEMAVNLLESGDFDLVITDLIMENTDGIQVLQKAKLLNPETQVIILTGYGDMVSAIEALRNHADDYLLKPCEAQEMIFRVNRCLEKQELTRKVSLYQKLLPMCCVCKKIRDDSGKKPGTGEWIRIENFIQQKADLNITSSYCPDCAQKTMAEFIKKDHKPVPPIPQKR
jgi:DNA-binding NtrC family response regulator